MIGRAVRAGATALALLFSVAFPLAAQPPPQANRVRTVTDTLVGGVGGVAVDRAGFIYAADFRETVWKITPDGRAAVFATGLYGASGNAVDAHGNLLQSNFFGNSISRIDRHGRVERFAEGLNGPVGIAWSPGDTLYVCNCSANTVSKILPDGSVRSFATSDLFACPNGVTRASDGSLYVVNFGDGRMLKVSPGGEVSAFVTLPGGGNGHVTVARGALYATSFRGQRVYRVSFAGEVTPLAGTGEVGEVDGRALEARFTWPNGIAAGPRGDRLYVNDFLNRFPPTVEVPPVPLFTVRQIKLASLRDVAAAALREGGVEAMVAAYRAWKADPATASLFTETQINQLGYQLMGSGQLEAATRLFELNVESYPRSFNVYDSLAEAYMNAGAHARAIEFYERSLELNPTNTNAVRMIERIRGGN